MSTSPIVILVESDPILSSVLRLEFAKLDFAVLWAASNQEAEEYAAQTVANLVVLDAGSLERSGYKSCAHIHRRRGYANRPIVMTTNDMSSISKAEAETAGATILVRPYSVSDLIIAIIPIIPADDPLITHRPDLAGLCEPTLMEWAPNPTPWIGPLAAIMAREQLGRSRNEAPIRHVEGDRRTQLPLMRRFVRARPALESDLRFALERRQFQLLYQPIANCVTGDVEGFESLLRWHHPLRGTVPPLEFIPVAEATGTIFEIGAWVVATACAVAARWQKPHRVAVNVSPLQVHRLDLPVIISGILDRTGLPASRLEIELTEGILVEDTKQTASTLSVLRELGVSIVMDDFGTGYSGLSYLHAFKFDKVKIDRSFIMRLGKTEDATIIVGTMIRLAHDLGLSTVAEGVETVQQLTELRDLKCDQVQGYLLGRPAPMDGSIGEGGHDLRS